MPFSDQEGKDVVRGWLEQIPRSRFVLDVGPGSGTYGKMVREVLEPTQLMAIEVWAPWVERFHLDEIYDEVTIADIKFVHPDRRSNFDLVIIGDVIEHMQKHEAELILHQLIRDNRMVIISFPVLHLEQNAYEGNTFETHVDHWSTGQMDEYLGSLDFASVLDKHEGSVLAYYLVQNNSF